jgi:cytochrome c553
MKKCLYFAIGVLALVSLFFWMAPSSQAQTKEEKQFMKEHQKEMTTFMEKCSGCHSLQRIFAKKRSKEEWDKVLKIMAGKPHANISDDDLKKIEKWIGFMQSAFTP